MLTEKSGITEQIILYGYFFKQVPSEFKSIALANKLNNLKITPSELGKDTFKKWCKLIDFSIPKKESFRRTLSIPHPLQYILLAKSIEINWEELQKHYSKSKYSLTTPKATEVGIVPQYEMSEKTNRKIDNLALKKFILQADINRYYPSIYTHSIPWALHGKTLMKIAENQRNDNYFGNVFDRLARNLQDGQTIGIPIGPTTSFVIQEIIGAAIDYEFQQEYDGELSGFRYIDDMEFYFNSLEEAEKALNILNKILKKYELDLNNSKTKITKIPQKLESEWIPYFKKYKFRRNGNSKDKLIDLQNTDLKEFFNMVLKYKIELNDKGIVNYAIKVLRSTVIYKENWTLFESLLLQSILIDPTVIPIVFEIIEGYKYRGYPLNMKKISIFINTLIKNNTELRNDFEVSWALSFASKLNISIEENVTKLLLKSESAVVNILVMVLHSNNLLKGNLDFSNYRSLFVKESLYDENWLFYYECCFQGWLDQDKTNEDFNDDKFFKQLLDNQITFLDLTSSRILEEVKKSITTLGVDVYKNIDRVNEPEVIISEVIKEYSFSIDNNIIEEIIDALVNEINIMKESTETGEGPDETDVTGEGPDEMDAMSRFLDEPIQSRKLAKDSKSSKGDEWLLEFLSTNINKASTIETDEIHDYY